MVQKGTLRHLRKYARGIYDTSAIFYYVRQSTYRDEIYVAEFCVLAARAYLYVHIYTHTCVYVHISVCMRRKGRAR